MRWQNNCAYNPLADTFSGWFLRVASTRGGNLTYDWRCIYSNRQDDTWGLSQVSNLAHENVNGARRHFSGYSIVVKQTYCHSVRSRRHGWDGLHKARNLASPPRWDSMVHNSASRSALRVCRPPGDRSLRGWDILHKWEQYSSLRNCGGSVTSWQEIDKLLGWSPPFFYCWQQRNQFQT